MHSCLAYTVLLIIISVSLKTVNSSKTHQRFSSNLDRLLNRLDASTDQPPSTTVPTTLAPHRIRHAHWQQQILDNTFKQYDHFDQINRNTQNHDSIVDRTGDDSLNTKTIIKKTDDDTALPPLVFDDLDDEEDDDFDDEDLQADVRFRQLFTTSIGKSDGYSKTSIRKGSNKLYKYYKNYNSSMLATRHNSVPVKMTGGEDDARAHEEYRSHHLRMKKETECRIPQPKVIRVSEYYPSDKIYEPPCTKLYRCGEDTGCCEGNGRCGAKSSEKVELYFYVIYNVPVIGHHYRKAGRIEKLQFYNHTECECHDRSDEMPRDTEPNKVQPVNTNSFNNRCKCPSEYTVRNLANGSCSCDCFDKQRDCTKYKKGKEYFNHQDRLCIEMRTCTVPACDFGVYIRRAGRCPRKHEKYRTWPRFKP